MRGGFDFGSTKDISIPADPFERIIGQEKAVSIAKIIPKQRRNLLLVGPPGTGKSMIAKAIASVLPKPKYEISVLHNEQTVERPILQIRTLEDIQKELSEKRIFGTVIHSSQLTIDVAEKLGFRCKRCGSITDPNNLFCSECGAERTILGKNSFEEFVKGKEQLGISGSVRIKQLNSKGEEEVVFYERTPDGKILLLKLSDLKEREEHTRKLKRKIIVSLDRSLFVPVSGGSETELLGDVKHDPYGDHPEVSVQPYKRVVPGAVHEAHEGVLFVDELSTLRDLQRYLLTAMQEKKFSIVGRNATSSGASVKVEDVPCDFILVAATNINDLQFLIPPLRSRIRGEGYELLLRSYMEDTQENRKKLAQFTAQEITKDGRIPHASKKAVEELIKESRSIAKAVENVNGLSLRLRRLSGIIKLAGDFAVSKDSSLIEPSHIKEAILNAKPVEEQIAENYENPWQAGMADEGLNKSKSGSEIR